MAFLFLHGPGFNTFAERVILSGHFETDRAVFWNEPSRQRPGGDFFEPLDAFARWTASAERAAVSLPRAEPVVLVAHCLAVWSAVEIARRHPERIAGLVLIAPAFAPSATFRNVLRLAQQDLRNDMPEIAQRLACCAHDTRTLMDASMREGLRLALHDGRLFTHYWANGSQFAVSAAAQATPEAQFDVDSFFAVLEDMADALSTASAPATPTVATLALFGCRDPIAPRVEQERSLLARVPDATLVDVDEAGHFLHLDRPAHFAETVRAWSAERCAPAPAGPTDQGR